MGEVFYSLATRPGTVMAKKLKHEKELLKVALDMILEDRQWKLGFRQCEDNSGFC
jgi:hypothetical protein